MFQCIEAPALFQTFSYSHSHFQVPEFQEEDKNITFRSWKSAKFTVNLHWGKMMNKRVALELKKKGDSQANMKITFFSPNRLDKAVNYYQDASDAFKDVGDYFSAGECLELAGGCLQKQKDRVKAAQNFTEAAKAFQTAYMPQLAEKSLIELTQETEEQQGEETSTQEQQQKIKENLDKTPEQIDDEMKAMKGALQAIAAYDKASSILCEDGRFVLAAKLRKDQAEAAAMIENYLETVRCLRLAIDLYEQEKHFANVNQLLEREASLYAWPMKKFKEAIESFEELLFAEWNQQAQSGSSSLLQFTANKIIFNLLLCMLAEISNEQVDDVS